jgi:hypothetical protein
MSGTRCLGARRCPAFGRCTVHGALGAQYARCLGAQRCPGLAGHKVPRCTRCIAEGCALGARCTKVHA